MSICLLLGCLGRNSWESLKFALTNNITSGRLILRSNTNCDYLGASMLVLSVKPKLFPDRFDCCTRMGAYCQRSPYTAALSVWWIPGRGTFIAPRSISCVLLLQGNRSLSRALALLRIFCRLPDYFSGLLFCAVRTWSRRFLWLP